MSAGVVSGQTAPSGFHSEFGEAFLAGGLVGDVMDHVVVGASDAEEMCELEYHQPNFGILADGFCVCLFVLVHLAASVGDRQCDTGLHAPGLMITSASRKRLP
jgi:hypothetical protein